jgi:ribonuclease P protein component
LIGRLGERREFERLTRDGRRARSTTLWCRYLDDPTVVPPRVAFAIGRPVGSAVVRNRLRRRLRELLRAATSGDAPLLAGGLVLVGARPEATERSFAQLGDEVNVLLEAVIGTRRDCHEVPA